MNNAGKYNVWKAHWMYASQNSMRVCLNLSLTASQHCLALCFKSGAVSHFFSISSNVLLIMAEPEITHTYSPLSGRSVQPAKVSGTSNISKLSHENSVTRKSIHWKAPLVVVSSSAFASLIAVTHHELYSYWNNRPVANSTQQQWIARGGTAFAFLFKAACLISVSTAYVQLFWKTIRRKSYPTVQLNALYGVLRNPINFQELSLWSRHPLLAMVAIASWYATSG